MEYLRDTSYIPVNVQGVLSGSLIGRCDHKYLFPAVSCCISNDCTSCNCAWIIKKGALYKAHFPLPKFQPDVSPPYILSHRFVMESIVLNIAGCKLFCVNLSQCEIKRGPLSLFAFNPDPAAMEFDNSLYKSKPDPSAINIWIQLVKKTKHLFVIFG